MPDSLGGPVALSVAIELRPHANSKLQATTQDSKNRAKAEGSCQKATGLYFMRRPRQFKLQF